MGAITPVLSTLGSLAGAVSTTRSAIQTLRGAGKGWGDSDAAARRDLARDQTLTLEQLRARQALEENQSAQAAANERARMDSDVRAAEETRRAALKRAVARQRAAFGAQGTGSSGGSAQAVLLGLFDESDAERADRERLDGLRRAALDSDLSARRQTNLLQVTQLAERQRLERLSRFGA